MNILKALQVRHKVPRELRSEFIAELDITSIDRQIILSWIAFIFYCLFLVIDRIRWKQGLFAEYEIYWYYFVVHIAGILLFLGAALYITLRRKKIIANPRHRGVVIYSMVGIIFLAMFSNGVVQYYEHGSLVLYICYIFVANWVLAMTHAQRMIFNAISCAMILAIILAPLPEWSRFIRDQYAGATVRTIYEALGFTLIAQVFHSFDFNLRLQVFLNGKQLEAEKMRSEELERFKSRMYANLTHEFRAPLTIITGMAEQLARDPGQWLRKGVEMIKRHAANLLTLVNQILDLSKLEAGGVSVALVHGNIVPYLGYVTDSFTSFAAAKNISLEFRPGEKEIFMDYDPDKALNILSNLLSNAIKYTPDGGQVIVSAARLPGEGQDLLEVRVKDSGKGIPADHLEQIFTRFYQVEEDPFQTTQGTGIGLSLVKELTELMDGTIHVESAVNQGTEFTMHFPIRDGLETDPVEFHPASINERASSFFNLQIPKEQLSLLTVPTVEEMPRLLLIEDNTDVLQLLKSCLEDDYDLMFATDGDEGIRKAREWVPDMIVSDVMMPGKDGFAVCETLKQDIITSHIPIILLTGRADVESKLEGLEHGADMYMAKPFNQEELRLQLRNLIRLRRVMQQRYETNEADLSRHDSASPEDAFVARVHRAVVDNLGDADFGILQLCRAIGLSRTQLHNKLKALTGKSASHFIRHIRLLRGYDLLRVGHLNVSEVAYDVGFRDPNYFTRTFTEQFGFSPSKVREQGR